MGSEWATRSGHLLVLRSALARATALGHLSVLRLAPASVLKLVLESASLSAIQSVLMSAASVLETAQASEPTTVPALVHPLESWSASPCRGSSATVLAMLSARQWATASEASAPARAQALESWSASSCQYLSA